MSSLVFFHCDLCDVHICGEQQRDQHLTGSKHYKKLVQSGAVSVSQGQLTMIRPGNGTTVSQASPVKKLCLTNEMSSVSSSQPYKCGVCQVVMTGPEPYAQHISSQKHLKKVSASGGSIELPIASQPSEDKQDAEYRAKYLKDLIVIEHDQKIEDVFRTHFG